MHHVSWCTYPFAKLFCCLLIFIYILRVFAGTIFSGNTSRKPKMVKSLRHGSALTVSFWIFLIYSWSRKSSLQRCLLNKGPLSFTVSIHGCSYRRQHAAFAEWWMKLSQLFQPNLNNICQRRVLLALEILLPWFKPVSSSTKEPPFEIETVAFNLRCQESYLLSVTRALCSSVWLFIKTIK